MGNQESTALTVSSPTSGKLSRQPSKRRNTLSPSSSRVRSGSLVATQSARKLSSFRHDDEKESAIEAINKNRSKSFRGSSGQIRFLSSEKRHSDVCETSGLNTHQKAILWNMWRQLARSTVFDLGKRVFYTVFEHDPNLLVIINLEHLQDTDEWREHVNFRMHAQRFTHSLSQCMRNLFEPVVAADRLQEFGASYVNLGEIEYGCVNARIPHKYWDRLAAAITTTANWFLGKARANRTERNSLSVEDAIINEKNFHLLSQELAQIGAWNVLATFVSNQIRFGYEIERMLKTEMKKLGLNQYKRSA